ncbi:MAG TPA: prenyltransferase [Rhodocyclaceae bacterium]
MSSAEQTLPAEPTANLRHQPALCLFLATRPAFLSVTLAGVLLGLACAWRGGAALHAGNALLTLVFALVAHAAANVINDFHDAANDAANTERLYPFTGGSRFIQNGVLSAAAIGRFGYALLLLVIPAGLWIAAHSGVGLLPIGMAGLLLAWAYSAPPLKLASRGLGEFAVAGGWWLIVVGSDYVQRGSYSAMPLLAGLGYGLMVANLLYINQFPDAPADAAAGKRTLVVRLGRRRAAAGYGLIALLAALPLLAGVLLGLLPPAALVSLLALMPALQAFNQLRQNAEDVPRLLPAIKLTILAAHLYGALLAAALLLA